MSQANSLALQQKSQEFINKMFYGTLLRDFRRSQQNAYFDQGTAGRVFWQLFDSEIIRHMSQAEPSGLAKDLMKHLGASTTLGRELSSATDRVNLAALDAEVRHG